MITFPIILVGLLLLVMVALVGLYNSLSKLKVRIKEAWSQIDVQLKRRVDLVPNLVNTVKGYATHEEQVFDKVTQARASLMNAGNAKEAAEADVQLGGALKSLIAVAEAYPELKAQEGFLNLQKELSDIEEKIAYSRQFYNSVVRDFNSKIVVFPNNLIAGAFGFKEEQFFEAEQTEREPVEVKF
jgi:LemA protein